MGGGSVIPCRAAARSGEVSSDERERATRYSSDGTDSHDELLHRYARIFFFFYIASLSRMR